MSVSPIFFLYADTARRRRALAAQSPLPEEYLLYGLPDFTRQGLSIDHNLNRGRYSPIVAKVNKGFNLIWHRAGGYGGDWATVLRYLPQINRSRLVFSTVDRVGIPLVLLKYLGVVSPPILYVSIGLPERLAQIQHKFMLRLYKNAFQRVSKIICYGFEEAEELKAWFEDNGDLVQFVPFAVNTELIYPKQRKITTDVLSVGADPYRDFSLLIQVAQRQPETSVRLITNRAHAQKLTAIPANMQLITDIPLVEVLEHIASARVIVLPVKANSYSGATTVLLQAMAMEKPVVVSAVRAISQGYGLQDGTNCKLVQPGNVDELERAISTLLLDLTSRQAMGNAARQTVVEYLSWERYVETLIANFNLI